jgi:hypothetical protein
LIQILLHIKSHFNFTDIFFIAYSKVRAEFVGYYKLIIVLDYFKEDIVDYIKEGIDVPAYSRNSLVRVLISSKIDIRAYERFIVKFFILLMEKPRIEL